MRWRSGLAGPLGLLALGSLAAAQAPLAPPQPDAAVELAAPLLTIPAADVAAAPVPAEPVVAALAPAAPVATLTFERDWCTGVSPVSWAFSVATSVPARELRLRVLSKGVRITDAKPGPSLPAGWAVRLESPQEAIASGEVALAPGTLLRALFIVETNRSTGDITARGGCTPVRWEVVESADPGGSSARAEREFPAVLELSDAVSRGVVLATLEPLAASGPVEITVDNPTWAPLMLDMPPGTILEGEGQKWVVGLVPALHVEHHQKVGKTRDLFPLLPPSSKQRKPRRLSVTPVADTRGHVVTEVALAVQRLRDETRADRVVGPFEALFPSDFWHLVIKWSVWDEVADPPREMLDGLVGSFLDERATRGDVVAASLDRLAAAAEVGDLLAKVGTTREAVRGEPLALAHQASRTRFERLR